MAQETTYTHEIGEKIYEMISTTSLGMRSICEKLDLNYPTVRRWINKKDHPMQDIYARAKELQIDHIAEEILDISDDGRNDFMTIVKGDASYEQENKEVTNRSKLRVDSRKWLLSKLQPKKYGDKIELGGELSLLSKTVKFED